VKENAGFRDKLCVNHDSHCQTKLGAWAAHPYCSGGA